MHLIGSTRMSTKVSIKDKLADVTESTHRC